MKKFILIVLVSLIALTTIACSSNELPSAEPTEFTESEATIPVEDAVQSFKADPYCKITGYTLDDEGYIYSEEGSLGSIHTDVFGITVDNPYAYQNRLSRYYVSEDNIISRYSFGECKTFTVGSDAVYCGYTGWGLFIFRKGSDVYSVDFELTEMKKIATGVKLVIDCDYYHSSDAWSQPLFLMVDGSLKAYIHWEEEPQPLLYEGGYLGTYLGNQ